MKTTNLHITAVFVLAVSLWSTALFAQTKIGGTAGPSDANAYLQLGDAGGNRGLLLSRVSLTATTNATPLAVHVAGMIVYNTATAGDVTPGFYYNDGAKWVRISNADINSAWMVTGNTGTKSGVNYLGTTDNASLRIRTNKQERMVVDSMGNVGIGIKTLGLAAPKARLQVDEQSVLFGKDITGQGTRMFWNYGKGAFRAGELYGGTEGAWWDDANTGKNSVAMGYNVLAKGNYSTSFGYNNQALGDYSVTMGVNNIAENTSVVLGNINKINGWNSGAIGAANEIGVIGGAGNDNSFAGGYGNKINMNAGGSVALGNQNTVEGSSAVAMGFACKALGSSSISMGQSNTAVGNYTFVVGNSNTVTPQNAGIVGESNTIGEGSNNSFAAGWGHNIKNNSSNSTALGTQNIVEANSGNSTTIGFNCTAAGGASTAIGWQNKALGQGSVSMGIGCESNGIYSFSSGNGSKSQGSAAVSLGSDAIASGASSFAAGFSTRSDSAYSVSMGFGSKAQGNASAAIGNNNTASGKQSFAVGWNNNATGAYALAMGNNNTASGYSSIALGERNTVSKNYALALGADNVASEWGSMAIGLYAKSSNKGALVIGDAAGSTLITSTADNQFTSAFSGGYRFLTDRANPASGMTVAAGNVGIGTAAAPVSSAYLQLGDATGANKGLLLSRVALTSTTSFAPLTGTHVAGMIVYNTATAGDVTPGFYYNDGTKWVSVSGGSGGSASPWFDVATGTSATANTNNVYIMGKALVGTNTVGIVDALGRTANFTVVGGNAVINGLTIGRGGFQQFKNTVLGDHALFKDAGGDNNTAIGYYALADNTNTEGKNTAVGSGALQKSTGRINTAVGYNALQLNTTGEFNTAVGTQALQSGATGQMNVAVGHATLFMNTADNNTAVGSYSLGQNTTGTSNTALGNNALSYNKTGRNNTAVGALALQYNTTGQNNTAIGTYALINNTGSSNVAIGMNAGAFTTGSNNIIIGNGGELPDDAGDDQISIGKFIYKTSAGNMGIGTNAPLAKLHVRGDIKAEGNVSPIVDNYASLGTSALKWTAVYATNGTIQTSDIRLKSNITPLQYGLKDILKINPISYNWKSEPNGKRMLGVSAQQLQPILPEVINVGDDEQKTLGVNYSEIVPVLINAVKEQQSIIEKQQALIDAMDARLKALENKK